MAGLATVEYYTPSIEEFCVGFEFQSLDIYPTEWKDDQACRLHDFVEISKWIEKGEVRVKVLDHNDFLELGFTRADSDYIEFFIKDEVEIRYIIEIYGDRIKIESIIDMLQDDGWRQKNEVLFFGQIRNKFELNKILNQVKWTN